AFIPSPKLLFALSTLRVRLSKTHNAFCPSYVRVEPIAIVCSGWMATLILSSVARMTSEGYAPGPETIVHSSGIIMLLRRGDGDLTTMKFIHVEVKCLASPIFTGSRPSAPSSSPKGGNKISELEEKLCVIFCLATLCHG
nr:hypothetical protein [Tanacetum cinerariifolium]